MGPVLEVRQKTQMTHQEEAVVGKAVEDLGAIGVRGEELDPQGRMGPLDLWYSVGPRGFPGRDGLSTTMGTLTSTGLGSATSL